MVHNLSLEVYFCCAPSGKRRKKRSDSPAVSKWISDGFGDLRQEGARDTMEKLSVHSVPSSSLVRCDQTLFLLRGTLFLHFEVSKSEDF